MLRMPDYCLGFRCTADKCSDSCCIGWEIDIDADTAEKYRQVSGDFGERLHRSIAADSSGQSCFIIDEKERCPFLNENNLCDIIINLGEEYLCCICDRHPRYFEWFSDFSEGGIGLCCEEAARIILSQTKSLYITQTDTPDSDTPDDYSNELFDCLYSARGRIISHLENADIPLYQSICDVIAYCAVLQDNTDNYIFIVPEIVPCTNQCSNGDIAPLLEFLTTLEPISDKWIPRLREASAVKKLPELNGIHIQYLRNIAVYFIWRYFLKGVFTEEYISYAKIMAASVAVIGHLFRCALAEKNEVSLKDCAEIAKNYSKEIEYCTDNLDALADASYERGFLSEESLSAVVKAVLS